MSIKNIDKAYQKLAAHKNRLELAYKMGHMSDIRYKVELAKIGTALDRLAETPEGTTYREKYLDELHKEGYTVERK